MITQDPTIPWNEDEMIGFGPYNLYYLPLRTGERVTSLVFLPGSPCSLGELRERAKTLDMEIRPPKQWRRAGR